MPCCGISLKLEVDHAMQDAKFVVDSGPLKVRKLLGIPIGMPQLPDVRGDMALVVRNRAGGLWPLSSPTSGEKAWGDYETWYLVDLASREFANSYNDVLLTSDAGFEISITAAVQVIDPAQAVVHQNTQAHGVYRTRFCVRQSTTRYIASMSGIRTFDPDRRGNYRRMLTCMAGRTLAPGGWTQKSAPVCDSHPSASVFCTGGEGAGG